MRVPGAANPIFPIAKFLGYHAAIRLNEYDDRHEECFILGMSCWWSGSSLGADDLIRVAGGDEQVLWMGLLAYWKVTMAEIQSGSSC